VLIISVLLASTQPALQGKATGSAPQSSQQERSIKAKANRLHCGGAEPVFSRKALKARAPELKLWYWTIGDKYSMVPLVSTHNFDSRMVLMRFYRGIAVSEEKADSVIQAIKSEGLHVDSGGSWKMLFHDLKPSLKDLWNLETVSLEDTRPKQDYPDWVCACAEKSGASYYACHHNYSEERNTPLLISFEADVRDVIVDGRDFLYTAFQGGDPDRAMPILVELFGPTIRKYLERAWATKEQNLRIAMCDLAINDDDIVEEHARNNKVINGRYRTTFKNAFMVRLPVSADRIVEVERIKREPKLEPDITLDMVRTRPNSNS
jgi:hypothetical protein